METIGSGSMVVRPVTLIFHLLAEKSAMQDCIGPLLKTDSEYIVRRMLRMVHVREEEKRKAQ